jgi:Putative Ig domain/Bacterial Ig-like domain (group 3)
MRRLPPSAPLALAGAAAFLIACSGSDLTLPDQGLAAKIVIVRGDPQTAAAGSQLPDSLIVRVTDSKDRPIVGQVVGFTASAGTVVPATAATNTDGRAGAIWALGPVAGPQTVTATANGNGAPPGLVVTFHATATASTAAKLDKAAGDGQQATVGSLVATPPAVKVTDAGGNPVAGVAVTFAVTAGGGSVNPITPVSTDATGVAAATSWTLGPVGGLNSLTATIPGAGITGNPATFAATGIVGNAGRLGIAQQPSATAQSGVPFAQQPQVQVQDAQGNPVKTAGIAVTATLASGVGAGLSGQLTVATDANGVAAFTNLALTGPQGTYTLAFSSLTLSGVTSAAITLGAGAAAQLVIVQQPAAAAQSGILLNPQPAVQLEDAEGNPVAQAGVAVTAALNGAGASLSGPKTQPTDASGKATFADLVITGSTGQYSLSFTSAAPALAVGPSITIGLGAGAPAKLILVTPPSASVASGQIFPQQPVIQVVDGAGNPAGAAGITVGVAITTGGGTLGGTPTAATNASGVATFAGLSITGMAGVRQLTFSSPSPSLAPATANVTVTAGSATQIAANSPTGQSATVSTAVPAPPSVIVRDANSTPVPGVAVTFAVTTGGGAISPVTPVTTNASGIAALTTWTLGPTPGANQVTATVTGLTGSPVAFNATGVGALTITAASPLPSAEANAAYSTAITVSGGSAPYTWSVSAGTLPAGLGLAAATGAISGKPTTAGTSPGFTIQLTDAAKATVAKGFTITILPAVTITTASLPGGTVGTAYSQTLAAGGGQAPYGWSVSAGTLPAGLALNATMGAITGTPTAVGSFNFTVRVTDALGGTSTKAYKVTIVSAPTVTTTSLPNAEVGAAFTATLTGTGGTLPYTWSLASGSLPLPSGLNLASTGAISGTPASPGTFTFTVQLTDAGSATATKALQIVVRTAVGITTVSMPNGAVGVAYSQPLAAANGQTPYAWSVVSGSLPAGLFLNSASGIVSGTPTGAGGPFPFTVKVADALGGIDAKGYSITIASAPVITTSSLPTGEVGIAYAGATLAATGGQPPYTWSIQSGGLDGLTLNTGTGGISGIPSAAGTFPVTFLVTDANSATATKALSLVVRAAVAITTTSLPNGSVGSPYSQTIAVSGGQTPYTWSVSSGALPPGLLLGASTGVISGTPTAAGGPFGFTIAVTDALGGGAARAYSITIAAATTTTSVSSSDASSVFGESVTFRATVSSGGGTPDGTVTFKDGGSCGGSGTVLDTQTLAAGVATSIGISSLAVATHSILACYSGSGTFAPSSGTVSQVVAKAATTTQITGDLSLATSSSTPLAVSFAVSVTPPGAGTPTGTVTVQLDKKGGGGSCSAPVSAGSCTIPAPIKAGSRTVKASYGGDARFVSSASGQVPHTVTP